MNPTPRFVSVEDVITLHRIAIEDQGGDPALRDRGLLESAVAMPAQQFSGEYLHDSIPAMAAAYAFHICKNHPFADGNKRAAIAAMIVFLSDNGWSFDSTADEAEPVILQLAASNLSKELLTEWVTKHCHEKPRIELREFFAGVDANLLISFQMATKADPQAHQSLSASTIEASDAMPLIEAFVHAFNRAESPSERQWYATQVSLLTALYRIAEDMGYEW